MRKLEDVMVPMADGVRLATDIYLPDEEAAYPTLIKRTPYGKAREMEEDRPEARAFVDAGHVVVVQDVRGRYRSEGTFVPYQHEIEDGVTLMAWVREQPWCNGHLGTNGLSYHGGTQWLPATRNPEGLEAMPHK